MRERCRLLILPILGLASSLSRPSHAQLASSEKRGVVVHLEGDDDAVLQLHEGDSWVDVCSSPCDRALAADGHYRLNGPGIRRSKPFALSAESGASETLRAATSSPAAFVVGGVLIGVGAVGVLAGSFLTFAGVHDESCATQADESSGGSCSKADPELVGVGLAVLIPSALAVIGGVVMMATNGRSSVAQFASSPRIRKGPHVVWFGTETSGLSERKISAGNATRIAMPSTTTILTIAF